MFSVSKQYGTLASLRATSSPLTFLLLPTAPMGVEVSEGLMSLTLGHLPLSTAKEQKQKQGNCL